MTFFSRLALSSLLVSFQTLAWQLKYNWKGEDFFNAFGFDTFNDPTHGEVNYLDQGEAAAKQLAYAQGDTFFMRADANNTVSAGARGRDSVRISSTETFSDVILILDLVHMPDGCSTWPAFWTVGPDWPNGGEVDIIEGVNGVGSNLASLHTGQGCNMPSNGRQMSGTTSGTSCFTDYGSGNEGCSVTTGQSGTFGSSFNGNGGGWWAYERSSTDGINVWFFPANGQVPDDVEGACDQVDPTTWGTPIASFPVSQCSFDSILKPHQIVFDLTFCGDWAGGAWSSSGCAAKSNGLSCADYVDQTPDGFAQAYWEIDALRVYE
ncbi:family 16 hypothetical endo-1,3(4)-beta-glucanase from glycoside hydrolase [Naematelia encephala]|uniref:Family 16 hypothetical endo-1,3(4)-beta-glucanase from glycoside hydrolase n=1 Tax=Naematelia encephala TaxID=71784 RepID=A0A1Y2APF5_9TREE|nr:family 16 hypothetical endo-1,3(4)-beta-glucanase from glycoside hydrolase [Naematelia encephala]